MDDLEYNPTTPRPPNLGVIYGKRRKLIETWEREIKLCEKDAPEQYADLEKLWTNYQGRLRKVVIFYKLVSTRLHGFDWG